MSDPEKRQTDPEMGNGTKDDRPEKTQSKLQPSLQLDSGLDDSSRTVYSLYSQLSEEEDNKMANRWQKNADGILIFAGLFSAAVAALLAVSVQDLRPNPQDTSAFYLANIYQVLANTNLNLSQVPIRPPVSGPPPFSPPKYAVWVNSLWFLSLVISLTCASLATSVQQWARRYLNVTQPPRCSPEKRARTRAFFARGLDKMRVSWAVESLPALLHFSLFLFLSGLIIFLHNVNHSVYLSVLLCVGLFVAVYGWITLMPVMWPESPYYTPLSTMVVWIIPILFLMVCLVYLVLFCVGIIVFAFYLLFLLLVDCCLRICCCGRLGNRPGVSDQSGSDADSGIQIEFHIPWLDRRAEEAVHLLQRYWDRGILNVVVAFIMPRYIWLMRRLRIGTAVGTANTSKIDVGILDWSVVALGEDETLEKFFEAIPAFLDSQKVKDLKRHLPDRSNFIESFGGFLGRTLSSNLISEEVKIRRLEICMNAVNKICDTSDIGSILFNFSRFPINQAPQSIQTAQLLTRLCTVSKDQRLIVACILPHVRKRDDSWIALARDQFGLEERVLCDNIAHGDNSVLLAIVLHVIRNHATLWDDEILLSLSRFDILNSNTGLQNEFCALWNEIVQQARDVVLPRNVLRETRHLYVALHQGTDAAPTRFSDSTPDFDTILYMASSYPMCNLAAHHPNSNHPPPTCNDDPKDAFPHPHPRLEDQAIPGGSTASQQAEEQNITPGLPSSSDSAHPLTQVSPSPSPTINPVDIAPQVISHRVPSVHESIQIVTLDSNLLLSERDSHLSCQPSLPSADLTVDIACPDMSKPDAPTQQT